MEPLNTGINDNELIEHGHKADWFNGSRIGRYIGKVGMAILKKLSYSKWMMEIYFKIVAFNDQIYHIPKNYNTLINKIPMSCQRSYWF